MSRLPFLVDMTTPVGPDAPLPHRSGETVTKPLYLRVRIHASQRYRENRWITGSRRDIVVPGKIAYSPCSASHPFHDRGFARYVQAVAARSTRLDKPLPGWLPAIDTHPATPF